MSNSIVYGLTYFVESIIAIQYFEWMFTDSKRKKWLKILCVLLGYCLLYFIFGKHIILLNLGMFTLVNFLLIKLIYEVDCFASIFHTAEMTVFMMLAEMIVTAVLSGFSESIWNSSDKSLLVFFLSMISKFIYFIMLFLVWRFSKKKKYTYKVGWYGWTVLITPICMLTIIALLMYICAVEPISSRQEQIVLCISVISVIVIIISFIIYNQIQKTYEKNLLTKLDLQHEQMEADYYKSLLRQDESQKILMHDIRKHIMTLQDLLGNNQIDLAQTYVARLSSSKDLREHIVFSNDHRINVILNRYVTRFDEAGIRYNFDIRRDCLQSVSTDDCTVLLCNMLDNAFEACSEMKGEKTIELRMHFQEDTFTSIISMSNDCIYNSSLKDLKTTKKDKEYHGYGIRSMKKVIRKYNGDIDLYYSEEDKRFHTVIYLAQNEMV